MKKLLFSLALLVVFLFAIACSMDEPTSSTPIYIASVNATAHADTHENNGSDEIEITGLSGLLADDQHVLDAEVLAAIDASSGRTLDTAIGKGTWTVSGTWTLPAFALGGGITLNSQQFNAGASMLNVVSTSAGGGINLRVNTNGNDGSAMWFTTNSNSPAVDDRIGALVYEAVDSALNWQNYGWFSCLIADPTDTLEDGYFKWQLIEDSAVNEVMRLTSNGTLYVDGTYETFDEYDDAVRLKKAFSQGEKEALVELGVLVNTSSNGTESFMIDTQKMMALLAGGVYQNRDKIDVLEKRIIELEAKLK